LPQASAFATPPGTAPALSGIEHMLKFRPTQPLHHSLEN
jgi:hypothetical protein